MPDDPPRHLDPLVQNLIRKKARQLVGRAGLRSRDRADVEQELTSRVLQRLTRAGTFPPRALYRSALEQSVADFLRVRQAQRRDPQRTEELEERDEGLTQQAHDRRHRRRLRSFVELSDLRADLAALLEQASAEDRAVAEQLLAHGQIQSAARAAGIPRSTFADRVRRLRQRFEEAGLREYL